MSTKDRTREKLLNSMRKTKAVINDQPETRQSHAETYAPPAAKPAKRPAPTSAGQERPPVSTPSEGVADPYQSRGRVWPD